MNLNFKFYISMDKKLKFMQNINFVIKNNNFYIESKSINYLQLLLEECSQISGGSLKLKYQLIPF